MKKILLAFTALMMVGCISDDEEAKIYEDDGFATLTYDSCEYVFKTSGYKGFLAHKGNCRFCEKRDSIKWEKRKKELEELVTKLKEK
jgi:hypothetical protein